MHPSKVISDVTESAVGAKAHFDMWWALAGEARGKQKETMHAHTDYFAAVWDAHYTAFFVYLAHIFDRRIDSSSIPTYLTLMEGHYGIEDVSTLRAEFEQLAQAAKPILTARHKTVAHVDAVRFEKDIFAQLDISWGEIRQVLTATIDFVAKLQGSSSPSELGIPRDGRLREATFEVLSKLGKA